MGTLPLYPLNALTTAITLLSEVAVEKEPERDGFYITVGQWGTLLRVIDLLASALGYCTTQLLKEALRAEEVGSEGSHEEGE